MGDIAGLRDRLICPRCEGKPAEFECDMHVQHEPVYNGWLWIVDETKPPGALLGFAKTGPTVFDFNLTCGCGAKTTVQFIGDELPEPAKTKGNPACPLCGAGAAYLNKLELVDGKFTAVSYSCKCGAKTEWKVQ